MDWNRNTNKRHYYVTVLILCLLYSSTFYTMICSEASWYSLLIIVYFTVTNILSFYKVSLLDPGYVRENKSQSFELEPLHYGPSLDVLSDPVNNARKLIIADCENKTKVFVQKYCLCCNIFRSSKTSHCSECNRCILEKDHHCLWLDTCIGRNNYRHFVIFVTTSFFLTTLSLFTMKNRFSSSSTNFSIIFNLLLLISNFMVFLLLLSLFLYNIYLGLIDCSSREFLRQAGRKYFKFDLKQMVIRMSQIKPLISSSRNLV